MKFIHLTDTHLVTPGAALYGLDPLARLEACVADIAANHSDAEFCIVTGDLAHQGKPDAYAALRRALAPLGMPVHLLLGNHDDRAAFRAAFPEAPVDGNGFVQSVVDVSAGALILIDSNEPGTACGHLCRDRLRWLADCLTDTGPRPVFLFLHHAPFDVGIPSMDRIRLRDGDILGEILLPHTRRIRHLFFGHLHRPLSGSWRGIPFSTLYGTNHQVALDFIRGDAVPGSHEPPAYAVVLAEGDRVLVHPHSFLDRTATFDL